MTLHCTCGLYEKVFFVDDVDDPEWKVVIQAEPRSRSMEGVVEPLLGARGAAREVGVDLGLQPSSLNEVWL